MAIEQTSIPDSQLDLIMRTTNSMWGSGEVPKDLKDKLTKYFKTKEGKTLEMGTWGLLGMFTRDLRLANLTKDEMTEAQHYLNLANDLLQIEMIEPFIVSISRVASILELSQSKGGFFRRQLNTFRKESVLEEKEPPKRKLWGGQQQKQQRGY